MTIYQFETAEDVDLGTTDAAIKKDLSHRGDDRRSTTG
jgi:hypothetical protein